MKLWPFGKKATETRSNTRNPAQWLIDWVTGGDESASGERVTYETALKVAAVWACVRNISEDTAKIPLVTYRRLNRGKERATEHQLYPILHDSPNGDQSSFDWRSTMTQYALMRGNGYAEIVRDASGAVAYLSEPIDPNRVSPKRRGDGTLYYEVMNDGQPVPIAQDRIFHLRGMGNGIEGYSVISYAKHCIGGALAAEKFAGSLFKNGLNAQLNLSHPGKLSDQAIKHLRESLAMIHSGAENGNKPLITEEGMTANKLSINPDEAQFLESRQYSVVDVCRWFRMPPHKVAELSRATFSNIEQQSIEYVGDTLMPWLVRWEQEIQRKLVRPSERKTIFAEHLISGLLRADIGSRYAAYALGRQNGFLSTDDIRDMENMNPIEGEGGGAYLVNGNMISLSAAAVAKPKQMESTPDDAIRSAPFETLLAGAFQRVLNVEQDRAGAAQRKNQVEEWRGKFYAEHPQHVESAIRGILLAVSASFGAKTPENERFSTEVRAICREHCDRSAQEATDAAAVESWANGTRAREQAEQSIKRIIEVAKHG